MTPGQIETYLSAVLDQPACRRTLTEALVSRLIRLRTDGILPVVLLACLENLHDHPDQLNREVIIDVMEWVLVTMESKTS